MTLRLRLWVVRWVAERLLTAGEQAALRDSLGTGQEKG